MKQFFLAYVICSFSLPAVAEPMLSLPLQITEESSLNPIVYDCENGEEFHVTYINAGENHLAVIPVGDADRIFVNVIAASGARYVAQELEWWTKGNEATFTDLLENSSKACSEKK